MTVWWYIAIGVALAIGVATWWFLMARESSKASAKQRAARAKQKEIFGPQGEAIPASGRKRRPGFGRR